MIDLIRENLLSVITLVQEKYGELTSEEIDTFRQNPEKLFGLLETKFGVKREEVEDFLGNNLKSSVGNKVDELASQGLGLNSSITSPLDGNLEGLK